MWSWLRGRRFSSYKFRRQHPLGEYILDFFCSEARLNIEVDGFQHGLPVDRLADSKRDQWLEERGVRVLRYWSSQLRRKKQEIRDAIWSTLHERAPHPLPEYTRPGLCTSSRVGQLNSPHPNPLPRGEGAAQGTRESVADSEYSQH